MRNCKLYLFVFLLCTIAEFAKTSRDVPSSIKVCSRDDVFLDDCLKTSIQSAITTLASGLPEIGFRPLDPYEQKELTVEYRKYGVFFKAVLSNIKSYGLGTARIRDVRSNIQDDYFELEIDLFTKKVVVEGTLRGDGYVFTENMVLGGVGHYNNTVYDAECTWKMSGRTETKKGEKYLKIEKFSLKPEIGDMDVYLPRVSANEELDKFAHFYISNNWRLVYNELLPIVDIAWQKIGVKLSNKFFSKIPYNKLFPKETD